MKDININEEKMNHQEWCKKQAIQAFNATWDLMDKQDRTEDETALMIHTAHASCYLWGFVGTPLNQARGEWQISRVYAISGDGEKAVYHAQRSLNLCLEHNYGDFDLAFCYEAFVRGYKLLGKQALKELNIKLAIEAAEGIAKKDDKDYFLSELNQLIQ